MEGKAIVRTAIASAGISGAIKWQQVAAGGPVPSSLINSTAAALSLSSPPLPHCPASTHTVDAVPADDL